MSVKGSLAIDRTIVLVGLMGAGKSCIGRRIAGTLKMPFFDSDREIEQAAGCTVSDIFSRYGEEAFRDCERRVIGRLLDGPTCILASGGGAFMNEQTRAVILEKSVSLWLRAELDLLVSRTEGRTHRPILQNGNGREILGRLINERYPVYALADIIVDSTDTPPDVTAREVLKAVKSYFQEKRENQ